MVGARQAVNRVVGGKLAPLTYDEAGLRGHGRGVGNRLVDHVKHALGGAREQTGGEGALGQRVP